MPDYVIAIWAVCVELFVMLSIWYGLRIRPDLKINNWVRANACAVAGSAVLSLIDIAGPRVTYLFAFLCLASAYFLYVKNVLMMLGDQVPVRYLVIMLVMCAALPGVCVLSGYVALGNICALLVFAVTGAVFLVRLLSWRRRRPEARLGGVIFFVPFAVFLMFLRCVAVILTGESWNHDDVSVIILAFFLFVGFNFSILMIVMALVEQETEATVRDAERHRRELETRHAISEQLANHLSLDELVEATLALLRDKLDISAAGFYMLQNDGRDVVLMNAYGLEPDLLAAVRNLGGTAGTTAKAVISGCPMMDDTATYPVSAAQQLFVRDGFVRIASFPILSASKPLGALTVAVRNSRQLDVEEFRLLTDIGRQMGPATFNALLYGDIRKELQERKRVEKELSLFFENAIEMLGVLGDDWSLKRFSPSWTMILGWDDTELRGKSISDLIHPDDKAQIVESGFGEFISGRVISYVCRFLCKDSRWRWLEWNTTGLPEHHVILVAARDITEQIRSREELMEAKDRAEEANRLKSEFLANISHEIRTPLNAVIGFSDLLRNTVTEPESAGYLEAIASSGNSLLNLINDILDLSKLESGMMNVEPAPLDLSAVLNDIRDFFSIKAQEKGLNFTIRTGGASGCRLLLDEARIRQVLINLVGNAVKFTEKGFVRVDVFLFQHPHQPELVDVEFAIEDSGIGIPESQRQVIFDAFRQQDGQSTRRYGGTGLGLAICQKLVSLMNGRLMVDSVPGSGSIFFMTLPDVRSVPLLTAPAVQPAQVRFSPARVLVVDDVRSNRMLLKEILTKMGLTVEMAESGIRAVTMAEMNPPDLILMDIRMPGMDGDEAMALIRKDESLRQIPCVAVSAHAANRDETAGMGFDDFIPKPLTKAQVVACLRKYLKQIETGEPEPAVSAIDKNDALPVWPAQLRESVRERLEPLLVVPGDAVRRSRLNQLVEAVRAFPGMDGSTAFADSLAQAVERHDVHRVQMMCDQIRTWLNESA